MSYSWISVLLPFCNTFSVYPDLSIFKYDIPSKRSWHLSITGYYALKIHSRWETDTKYLKSSHVNV